MNETKVKLKKISKDIRLNSRVLEELIDTLSYTDTKNLLKILKCINGDNVVVVKGAPANVRELSEYLSDSHDKFRRLFASLIKKDIICKTRLDLPVYNKYGTIYIVNPWVCSREATHYLQILNLFKDSKWRLIIDHDKDGRNSFEYALWEEMVKERDKHKCVICGETLDIETHHISPFSIDYDNRTNVANGVTLCKRHHNARVADSFHNRYGTQYNTSEQLQQYINDKREELGLSPILIEDIIAQ